MPPTPDGGKMGVVTEGESSSSDTALNVSGGGSNKATNVASPSYAAAKAAAVVLSDPVTDMDYVPGPGPGTPGPSPTTNAAFLNNPLVLPPKKASSPPYSVLLSPHPQQQKSFSAQYPLSDLGLPSSSSSSSNNGPINGFYPSVPLGSSGGGGSYNSSSHSPGGGGSSFTATFLRGILTSIDSKDPVVANAWLETLLDALDLLPSEAVRKEVLPVAVAKGQLSQRPEARRAACRLLGKVATRLDQTVVSRRLGSIT